jgi:hypothetical protein
LTDGGCRGAGEGQWRHICRREKKRWNDSFYFERVDYLALFIFPSIKMSHPLAHRH